MALDVLVVMNSKRILSMFSGYPVNLVRSDPNPDPLVLKWQ